MIDFQENTLAFEAKLETQDLPNLVLSRIRLLVRRRVAWLRTVWAKATENNVGEFNVHQEIDGYLFDRDQPQLESDWYKTVPEMQEIGYVLSEIDQSINQDKKARLNIIKHVFGLNQIELDILQICLAVSIEPNLGRVFAYLQDNSSKAYVTDTLIARLFQYGNTVVLPSDSAIKKWNLINEIPLQPGEQPKLEIDQYIKNWLLGLNGIDESIIGFTAFQLIQKPLENWPIQKLIADVSRILKYNSANKVRVFVEGPDGSGRRSFAANVAQQLGLSLLAVNSDVFPENRWTNIYTLVQRQAFLSKAAIVWYGDRIKDSIWPTNIPSFQLQFVVDEGDSKILEDENFINIRIKLPKLSFDERLQLWKKHVPLSATWPRSDMQQMVLSHETTIGKIVSIGHQMTATITEAYAALRTDSRQRLGSLAQLMPSTFTFDDLVVPDNLRIGIEDFIFEATERIEFWDQPNAQRLFPQGRNLIGLFTGSPGTGKTMTAQVIASALKLELFRIDLSSVISKYIGESSKNIEKILTRAKNMNVVLFFDEADSLFGKRTEIKDSHDRYANTDTNYLLQEIENYPGIIILASNKASNIDNGFMRRFRYLFDFREPDGAHRFLIWKKIIGEMYGQETAERLNSQLFQIAQLVEITGAQIKQAVLSSIFLSRKDKTQMNIQHIIKGIERELVKQGKGLNKQMYQHIQ
jgi:AAA+ superfamily predicted ATPase